MKRWIEIRVWRDRQRTRLRKIRDELGAELRREWSIRIESTLRLQLQRNGGSKAAFYWPLGGEIDLRPYMRKYIEQGGSALLPVVVQRHRPLEFRRWWPGMPMYPDARGIPSPKWRDMVEPDVIVIPMLGFDDQLYRLGYGGGYFDRTLCALESKPFCIGISFECCRLNTIYPQPHDIPLDAIVTEDRVRFQPNEVRKFGRVRASIELASPPCYAEEFIDEYLRSG